MTREEIIQGLQFTIDMFLSDPLTGEPITKPRNDMDKTTIDACKGAIELLKQQPCEDAISREQAIDAVANLFEMSEYLHPYPQGKPIRLKDIKEKLKQLPPVTSQPKTGHWISISESLPEYGKEVLTCSNGGFIEIQSLEDNDYWENQKGDWTDFDEVIAWMPLPEPYEPQESEDKE